MIITVILRKRGILQSEKPFFLFGGCKMDGLVIGYKDVEIPRQNRDGR